MYRKQSVGLGLLFLFVFVFAATVTFVSSAQACYPVTYGCCSITHDGEVVISGHYEWRLGQLRCICASNGECCVHQCLEEPEPRPLP